jgi:hypothetical protein
MDEDSVVTLLCRFRDGKFEVREAGDGDLAGTDRSFYAAVARLCIQKLEREHRLGDILDVFKFYKEKDEAIFRMADDFASLLSEAHALASSPATGDESLPRIASLIRRAMGEEREGVKG